MIKTYTILCEECKEYNNPKTKIQRMVNHKDIFPVIKGIYETDPHVNPFYLANPIYSPSYISFETALAFHGLIPERVCAIKNATFEKKKKKEYNTPFGLFMYQDIPSKAFPFGKMIFNDGDYMYIIATKEKALLDTLYATSPINNMKEMREFLFDNLRINELILDEFDKKIVSDLSKLYHSRNIDLFERMLRREKIYD